MPHIEDLTPDDIETMRCSLAWRCIEDRLISEIERQRTELEKPLSPQTTERHRGIIEGLRIALRLPETLELETN